MKTINNIGKLAALFILILCAVPSYAQSGDLRIAYVDLQALILKSPQAATASKSVEKELVARQDKLKNMAAEIQTLREKRTKDRVTLSDEEYRKLDSDIFQREREYRWQTGIFDEDAKIMQNRVVSELKAVAYAAIVEIAKEDKYDLVLTDGVLYHSTRVDITDKVLDRLKGASKK